MIGDIAGSKYEFNNTFDYDFEMFGEGCDFTDDTICTVAIADAILNGRSYQESLLGLVPPLSFTQKERMAEDSLGGFALLIRSHIIALAMVRRCEYRRWLGSSMTCRRFWKRQRERLSLLIIIPRNQGSRSCGSCHLVFPQEQIL